MLYVCKIGSTPNAISDARCESWTVIAFLNPIFKREHRIALLHICISNRVLSLFSETLLSIQNIFEQITTFNSKLFRTFIEVTWFQINFESYVSKLIWISKLKIRHNLFVLIKLALLDWKPFQSCSQLKSNDIKNEIFTMHISYKIMHNFFDNAD